MNKEESRNFLSTLIWNLARVLKNAYFTFRPSLLKGQHRIKTESLLLPLYLFAKKNLQSLMPFGSIDDNCRLYSFVTI